MFYVLSRVDRFIMKKKINSNQTVKLLFLTNYYFTQKVFK